MGLVGENEQQRPRARAYPSLLLYRLFFSNDLFVSFRFDDRPRQPSRNIAEPTEYEPTEHREFGDKQRTVGIQTTDSGSSSYVARDFFLRPRHSDREHVFHDNSDDKS